MSRQIVVDILGDASKFTKATKDATTSAARMKQGMKGALDGLPLGFLGVAGAAAALTSELVKGVKGAIDEEAGIAKLTAALKANVPAWDGNTAAIETAIKARTDMGFADDELRASLAKLVPATHDVSKAFDIQRTAMDLARLKGISLEDASQALVKVEAGQYRALKELGIVLKEGATQTEALAAVQAVAAGQAEAYMDTTAGKLELLSKKWDELTETVGGAAIPVLTDFITVLGGVGTELDKLSGQLPQDTEATLNFVDAIASFLPTGFLVKPLIAETRQETAKLTEKINTAAGAWDTATERSAIFREESALARAANKKTAASFDHLGDEILQTYRYASTFAGMNAGSYGKDYWNPQVNKPKPKPGTVNPGQGLASGGAGAGLTWVGEQGPELVNLPAGSFVHNNAQSRRMASGGAGVTVNVYGSVIGPSGVDELADMLARRLRLDGIG